jgi:hypothetical protein
MEDETVESLLASLRGRTARRPVDPAACRAMWSLIYAGREAEAWELMARVWEPGLADASRDAFAAEFRGRIQRSRWWGDLFGMGAGAR